tara:strand:- start:178 stop:381 length:204 start_codon:yes stop_codon:yes gene_type:complete
MAKSIQEMVEEAVKNMVEDGKLVIQDNSGDTIEDLAIAVDEIEDDDDDEDQDDDSESDEDEDEDSDE